MSKPWVNQSYVIETPITWVHARLFGEVRPDDDPESPLPPSGAPESPVPELLLDAGLPEELLAVLDALLPVAVLDALPPLALADAPDAEPPALPPLIEPPLADAPFEPSEPTLDVALDRAELEAPDPPAPLPASPQAAAAAAMRSDAHAGVDRESLVSRIRILVNTSEG